MYCHIYSKNTSWLQSYMTYLDETVSNLEGEESNILHHKRPIVHFEGKMGWGNSLLL